MSLFEYMKQMPDHEHHELVTGMNSFDEYLEWRVSEDKHLQKEFVTDDNGKVIVDFIGKYERLRADFNEISRRIGITARLPHLNRSRRKGYRKYYNAHTSKLIKEHFAEDIEMFGYEI